MSASDAANRPDPGRGAWRGVFADALDVKRAAEKLSVAPATIDDMVQRGDLVAVRLGGTWLLRAGSSPLTESCRECGASSRTGRARPSHSRCGLYTVATTRRTHTRSGPRRQSRGRGPRVKAESADRRIRASWRASSGASAVTRATPRAHAAPSVETGRLARPGAVGAGDVNISHRRRPGLATAVATMGHVPVTQTGTFTEIPPVFSGRCQQVLHDG